MHIFSKLWSVSKLKKKMILAYSSAFILVTIVSSLATYSIVNDIIGVNIQNELGNASYLIKSMIETAADTSIKNHLRTIAEKNLETTAYFYKQFSEGKMSEAEAKSRVQEVMSAQKIGSSGYIYILDSSGTLQHHPEKSLIDRNISEYQFVRNQMVLEFGYDEYMWQNPGDEEPRSKAFYMTYFEPWDWIISASSYKSEFTELINVTDFEEKILKTRFGKSGYPSILDDTGTFLIHPTLKGVNTIEQGGKQGEIIREIVERKSGITEYEWQNPGETKPRKKLMVFTELPEYKWIIASTSYKDDFYQSMDKIRWAFIITLFVSLTLIVAMTQRISSAITKPINTLKDKISSSVSGDLSVRVPESSKDEIDELAAYFNVFLKSLEVQQWELEREIIEKNNTAGELRKLNENLESIVEERTRELNDSLKELILAQRKLMDDMTERERIGKELFLAKEEAEQANVAKSEFLANMSHELRTPMNGVLGITQTMIKYDANNLTYDQIESLELIHYSGLRLLNLLNDILDLSKVEAGEMEVRLKPINLDKMINNTEKLFESLLKGMIEKKSVDLKFIVNIAENVPDEIISDEKRLNQILINLIGNSVKFTNEGSVTLSVYISNGNLFFEVIDTGIGISENDLVTVFDKFKQVDGSASRKYKGTGLGLSLCRELVRLVGGEIELKSVLNKGTVAKFYIPLQRIDSEDVIVDQEKQLYGQVEFEQTLLSAGETLEDEVVEKRRFRILVSDDEEIGRKIVSFMLRDRYDITFAENGSEAVEKYFEEQPDLVMMDIMMPGMNGFEAFTQIRKIDPTGQVPIIALTARAMIGEMEKIMEHGFDNYISKPIDLDILLDMLERYLKH